jgi:triacylglycerol lipase
MANMFKLLSHVIQKKEGENDGLVSVQSAKWRDEYFRGTLDACDHLNELGWWDPGQLWCGESPRKLLRRTHDFYAAIARDLP